MFAAFTTWATQNTDLIIIVVIVACLTLLASLLLAPWWLAQLPSNYFSSTPSTTPRSVRTTLLSVLRTCIGSVLIALGLVMLLTPVPGIFFLVIGLVMCDFPGKSNVMLKLIQQPSVFRILNWVRRKAHKPPFVAPPTG